MAVNLKAPVFLARAFAAALPAGGSGNVVNIVDQRVWKPTPRFFSYAASKMALWNVTRTLAQALAPRIRVNAIGPGPVLKSALQTDEEFRRQCEATILQRGTTPEEIAAAIRFILEAPAMTGQMIALDGGQHLAWDTCLEARPARMRCGAMTGTRKTEGELAGGAAAGSGVFVRDLKIVASVGLLEYEKRYEQRIVVSVDLAVRDDYDGVSDRLSDVLDLRQGGGRHRQAGPERT
jgi:hypothetical protein